MIEFLQDYQTTAVPPETFEAGQKVTRSDESEMYFVKLGIAAFVGKDGLIDADGRAIEAPVVGVVAATGEAVIGVEAPQRASTGPGNALLFGGDQQTAGALADHERALADAVAASDATIAQLHAEYGQKLDALTVDQDRSAKALINDHDRALATVKGEREDTRAALAKVTGELEAANRERDDLAVKVTDLTKDLSEAVARAEAAEKTLADAQAAKPTAKK